MASRFFRAPLVLQLQDKAVCLGGVGGICSHKGKDGFLTIVAWRLEMEEEVRADGLVLFVFGWESNEVFRHLLGAAPVREGCDRPAAR